MTPDSSSDESSWSLDELAERANAALKAQSLQAKDQRIASELTARNLRALVAKGVIDPPARRGREAFYGPKHLAQALTSRELMSQGFTASSLQSLRSSTSAESDPSVPLEKLASFYQTSSSSAATASSASDRSSLGGDRARALLASFQEPERDRLSAMALASVSAPLGSPLSFSTDERSVDLARSLSLSLSAQSSCAGAPASLMAAKALSNSLVASGAWIETPALGGQARLSVQARPGMAALTEAQKQEALAAFERAWEQARQLGS